MIYYFSATGNNKYVAQKIAEAIGDEAISIQECTPSLPASDVVGFVSPTYGWGLPEIMKRFFTNLSVSSVSYLFFVATYGTSPGFIGAQAKKMLAKRGQTVNAFFSVKMPDNWTPTYDLSDPAQVAETNQKADEELAVVLEQIKVHKTGDFMKDKKPYIASVIALPEYEKMRRTSHFKVDDTCIGCGLCEKKCPDYAIRMENKKPTWIKEQCIMCLGCLHRCPKFAIQYENRTREHGQYKHPGVKI